MKSIGHQTLKLPAHAPVMVLPGAHLFPDASLPLRIFEPRYRAMLTWSLEHDRMFFIAPMKAGISEARTTDDFHHIVGLGLIRVCIGHPDGTSDLVLQGLARVQLTGFLQETPFRMAELRELPSQPAPRKEEEELLVQLLEASLSHFFGNATLIKSFEEQVQKIADPAVLSDVIAHSCLREAEARQTVFEELNVVKRVALLVDYLRAEGPPPKGKA